MNTLDRRSLLGVGVAIAALPGLAITAASAGGVDVTKLMQPPPLGDMSMGNPKAKVTMIEYASATCPHCAEFSNDTFPTLKKDYIDTGKVRFIFREFPLDGVAMAAFMLARCAPKDKYFPLIETFFKQQQTWEANPHDGLLKIFESAGFSKNKFNTCIKDKTLFGGIKTEMLRAEKVFHVNATPTFFVNGKELVGAQPIDKYRAMIDAALKAS